MGVMPCHRHGCTSILCDTYIPEIGYVCSECQREFKNFLITKQSNSFTEGEILTHLKEFVQTEKNYYSDKQISVNDFFQKYTK